MLPIIAQLAAAATLAIPANMPVMPALMAQIQQSEGHYHEGELGLKYLEIEQSLRQRARPHRQPQRQLVARGGTRGEGPQHPRVTRRGGHRAR